MPAAFMLYTPAICYTQTMICKTEQMSAYKDNMRKADNDLVMTDQRQ